MALNIKNKRVCELARQAADRFETTQVDVIERALLEKVRQARFDRIMELAGEIHDSMTDEEREALRNVDREIYDEDGLPR